MKGLIDMRVGEVTSKRKGVLGGRSLSLGGRGLMQMTPSSFRADGEAQVTDDLMQDADHNIPG